MISNNNSSIGSNKDYVDTKCNHNISTETRNWVIRENDIRGDGSIPNAVLMHSPIANGVRIRRFHKLIQGERID